MDPSSTARGRVGAFFSRVRRVFSTKADGDDSSNKATAQAPDGTHEGIASCHSRFQYSSSARGAEFARGFSLPQVVAMPNADEDAGQRPMQPARVVFLGAKSCGKTSLCAALVARSGAPFHFRDDVPETMGCELVPAWLQDAHIHPHRERVPYGLHLWDFAGDRRFRALGKRALRTVHVLVLCCAGDNPLSVAEVDEFLAIATDQIRPMEHAVKLLVVLKTDLPPAVPVADLRALSVRIDARLVLVSAKTGEGVDQLRSLLWLAARIYVADTVAAQQEPVELAAVTECH